MRIETELAAAVDVDWFNVRNGRWLVDLEKLRQAFTLEYAWLSGTVVADPEFDLVQSPFGNHENSGHLALVFRPDELGESLDAAWGEYPDDELAELVPLLRRKAFERDGVRLFGDAHRCSAVMMIDIDHFKRVNDSFGHAAGDIVLTRVAQIVRDIVGRRGTGYRFGGEEFAVFLPDFSAPEALVLADRIRATVAAEVWPPDGPLEVTISAGVADGQRGAAATAVCKAADVALYRAKNGGRNRVEVAHEVPSE